MCSETSRERLTGMSHGRVIAMLLLVGACHSAPAAPPPVPYVPVELRVTLDRSAYAEGDPVYALVELRNVGTDTVCVPSMSLDQDWLKMDLSRDGVRIAGGKMLWVDEFYSPGYVGEPLPPGGAHYEPILLSERWSDGDRVSQALFLGRLPPGLYALVAQFNPRIHWWPGATVTSMPVAFIVRSRDSAENARYDLWMRFAKQLQPGHWPAEVTDSLMGALAARVAGDSADPLSATLAEFVATGEMVAQGRRDHIAIIREWQSAVMRHEPDAPAAAWAAARYGEWWLHGDTVPIRRLAESLHGTVAGGILDRSLARHSSPPTRCAPRTPIR